MTPTPCKNAAAVQKLLNFTDAENYTYVIDQLWEAWICGEFADGTNVQERASILTTIKELKQFLNSVHEV
ncbi:hypothetical protein [uncultured Draconibacterium sp.]|uniref:hypothetical protein n=1 Tax=uncultured Draconibacterium sp. TaxID=1573823 RepID=UPI0032166778